MALRLARAAVRVQSGMRTLGPSHAAAAHVQSAPHPNFASPFAHTVRVGEHSLLSDRPLSLGAANSGPTPYDLLLASLGACTDMTLKMYADTKHIPLQSVEIDLSHSKVYADDCAGCPVVASDVAGSDITKLKIDRIERLITLHGPELTDDQRARLVEVASSCPVHKMLSKTVQVVTKLSPAY
ncbi:OsmC/Ohr family [Pavlovales sp. CCMP2436]|nr:OsmC/Ohr family [Pavlovales sp. CCMP2436]|mmetsp:Transcript_5026/g.13024  ORF Transcript_5026/g.13024 Transcript_5026/m.13024 type:complete len:183 (-) Transcript_5026:382-930(-)